MVIDLFHTNSPTKTKTKKNNNVTKGQGITNVARTKSKFQREPQGCNTIFLQKSFV